MSTDPILELDPIIHAPLRLAVLSLLAGMKDADFVFIRESTGATDGNLSTHLAKLEEAGYVRIRKRFVVRKPQTRCAITAKGRRAFTAYLDRLAQIVKENQGT